MARRGTVAHGRGRRVVPLAVLLLLAVATSTASAPVQKLRRRPQQAHVAPMTTTPLLEQLAAVQNVDYFGTHRVFRYPDAPGQTKEELVACFRAANQVCGASGTEPCDPDDDASPVKRDHGYLPEDVAELWLLAKGNVNSINDPNIDLYVLNPFLVLSNAVNDCNGMNHSERMAYWVQTLQQSPATLYGRSINRRHVFLSVSWMTGKILLADPVNGRLLRNMASQMTFLLNEKNPKWAGLRFSEENRDKLTPVPYLAHRYLHEDAVVVRTKVGEGNTSNRSGGGDGGSQGSHGPGTNQTKKQKLITFIGSSRSNSYRLAAQRLSNEPYARFGMKAFTQTVTGANHRLAAWSYAQAILESTYCLQLPGDTITARRLFDAITAGCVPVVVTGIGRNPERRHHSGLMFDDTPEAVEFRRYATLQNCPFSHIVPYDDFTIFLDGEAWVNNTQQLALGVISTPDDVLQKLQHNLARWKNTFDYRSQTGDLNRMVVDTVVNQTASLPRPNVRGRQ